MRIYICMVCLLGNIHIYMTDIRSFGARWEKKGCCARAHWRFVRGLERRRVLFSYTTGSGKPGVQVLICLLII